MKTKVINQKTIRAENRKKILQLLTRKRNLTIPQISWELKISIPTVTKNINQLITEGIAEEAGVSESTGGRRPMIIRFLPDAYYSIGVEFAVGYVRVILTNLDFAIKADKTLKNVDFKNMDTLMKAIQFEVENLLQETKVSVDRTLGIGISLPGTVNEETKLLKIAPNIGIKNIDFTQYEPFFQFPLFVENDANLAAMAELTLGIAKTMRDLVYIYVLPIGIGCGIVVEGEICRGKNKRAGEVSHMTVASYGKQCLCGRRDCWELYASANVLLTMYREKTGKDIHTIEDFFASLEKYEPAATEVFDTYLENLALGIQNIMLIQDPHYIIIGGVLSRFEKFFLEPLQEKIFATNSFYTNNDVTIMWSLLKEDGRILGASLLPFERIFFSP